MSSREAILGRIRAAISREEAATEATEAAEACSGAGEHSSLGERSYLAAEVLPHERHDRLVEMLRDCRAQVGRVSESGLAAAVHRACQARGIERVLLPPGFPENWLPTGLSLVIDDGSTASLTPADGVISTCSLAIAQTGTIVLDGGIGQGRRALTLIPDYHLCIVEAARVVNSVPDAIEKLESAVAAGSPLTFISGPSATSDIELVRVEGVHGPRHLEVLIVE
ncbi:MAG: LUD domain-containing protein [Trueperaceae bacterium]